MGEETAPYLAAAGIGKSFGPVQVLREVVFEVRAGEVHALVGENGAGKSTLLKILAGQITPGSGAVIIDGAPVSFGGIGDAERRGIMLIHQELNLAPHLTVEQNIFLGREIRRGGFLDGRAMRAKAAAILGELGCAIDPATPVRTLTVAQAQMVEIAKAVSRRMRVLIMDEPTAVLTGTETATLLRFVRKLRAEGVGIAYISHKLDEVLALADRVTVLRDGNRIATLPAAGQTPRSLARLMVGRDITDVFPPKAPPAPDAPAALEVAGMDVPGWAAGVSFSLRAGEILGFAGLVGAGRTELMEGIVGLRPRRGGTVARDGKAIRVRNPRDAADAGIAYLTEDRKGRGLLVGQRASPNLTLLALRNYGRVFVDRAREAAALGDAVRQFDIRARLDVPVSAFSGGNQQKLLLAKTLQAAPRVLIVDEPTRGIDIGVKAEFYEMISDLAASGRAILLISSELPELLVLCDRILVMAEGRLTASFTRAEATQERVMHAAVPRIAAHAA